MIKKKAFPATLVRAGKMAFKETRTTNMILTAIACLCLAVNAFAATSYTLQRQCTKAAIVAMRQCTKAAAIAETGHAPSPQRKSNCLNCDFNMISMIGMMQGNSQSRRDFQGDIAVGFSQRKQKQTNHINQTNHAKITVQTNAKAATVETGRAPSPQRQAGAELCPNGGKKIKKLITTTKKKI